MAVPERHLRLIPGTGDPPANPGPAGDLVLMAVIFVITALPIMLRSIHMGRWGTGTLALSAVSALFVGRELAICAVAAVRRRRRS